MTFIEALPRVMAGFDKQIAQMAERVLIRPRPIDYYTGVFAAEVIPGLTILPPPLPLAEAIARIAGQNWQVPNLPRPAPLYLRAADAAPSRDGGPVMLPA